MSSVTQMGSWCHQSNGLVIEADFSTAIFFLYFLQFVFLLQYVALFQSGNLVKS